MPAAKSVREALDRVAAIKAENVELREKFSFLEAPPSSVKTVHINDDKNSEWNEDDFVTITKSEKGRRITISLGETIVSIDATMEQAKRIADLLR